MSYELIIRPEAEWDIQDAFEWYEAQTPGLGSEFVRAVDACLSSIGRNPLAYPIVYQPARRSLIRRFPYSILYTIEQLSDEQLWRLEAIANSKQFWSGYSEKCSLLRVCYIMQDFGLPTRPEKLQAFLAGELTLENGNGLDDIPF